MQKLSDFFPKELNKLVEKNFNKSIELKNIDYAFLKQRKLPLESKRNILSAIEHFFNVKNTSIEDKVLAYQKILKKAEIYNICTIDFIEQCKDLFDKNRSVL